MLLTQPQLGLEPAPQTPEGEGHWRGPDPSPSPAQAQQGPFSLLRFGGQFHGATHVPVSKLKVGVEVLFCGDGSGVGLAQGLSDQGLYHTGRSS